MEEGPAEISIIGKGITTLVDLPEVTDRTQCIKARVIHNTGLTSMAGISHLVNLVDLNISCNRIATIEGLHNMRNLRVLNLSNNRITVINGLAGLYSLEKLDLSTNRISTLSNLAQLYGPQYPFFAHLNLKGNQINQLRELNYLAGCQYLTDLVLCGQKESNAVCRLMEYQYTVMTALPQLQFLDQKPVNALASAPAITREAAAPQPLSQPILQSQAQPPHKASQSPVRPPAPLKEPPPLPEPSKTTEPMRPSQSSQLPVPPAVQREYQAEVIRLQRENEQLLADNRELLKKYDENDQYWTERCKRLDQDGIEKKVMADDLQKQVLKLSKALSARESRLEVLETDLSKALSLKDQREKSIEDLHGKIAQMMKDLGEGQKASQTAIDDAYRYRDRLEVAEKVAGELRAQLKQAEQMINQLHAKTMDSSNAAAQRVEETQRKWEAAEVRADQLNRENEDLRSRVKELLELNDKLEMVWSGKVREAESSREHTLATMKLEVAQLASQERERAQISILQEKEKFLLSTRALEDDWRTKVLMEQDKVREQSTLLQNLHREKTDLQQMLKMSVEKEAKSKGLIEELTELAKQMQESIENERRESQRVKAKAEDEISKFQKLAEACQGEADKLNRQLALFKGQAGEDETLLTERTREGIKLKREVQKLTHELEELEESHNRSKSKWEKAEFSLTEEVTSLQQHVSDLEVKVTTQSVLIDDYNETIRTLKSKLQTADEELDAVHSQRDQGKLSLESKLRSAYDDLERVQNNLADAEARIGELEEQVDTLAAKRNGDKATIKKLNEELQDKASAIDLIEREVMSLQDARKGEEADAIAERNHIIDDLKHYRDELMAAIAAKDKEIKEKTSIMRSMQTHIDTKEAEVHQHQARVSEMEGEIRVLLTENDRLRSLKAEAARLLKA